MNLFRVVICNMLALSLALANPLAFAQADILAAAEPDVMAPVINVKEVRAPAGDSQEIKIVAQAADNVAVEKFDLFFRAWGGGGFESTPFVATRDGSYVATIAAEKIPSQKLEYYIEATDSSGNLAAHGSSLSPRSVDIAATSSSNRSVVSVDPESAPLKSPQGDDKKSNWVWILGSIATAVVIGLLGPGGGGGGGGGETPGPETPTGTVSVINVPAP